MSDDSHEKTLACPVCRAVQQASDTCRRCRCDLSLVVRAEQAAGDARRQVLAMLAADRLPEARRQASALHALAPSAESRQLLAVCCLLAGDFAAAVRWAGEVPCESQFKRLAAQ